MAKIAEEYWTSSRTREKYGGKPPVIDPNDEQIGRELRARFLIGNMCMLDDASNAIDFLIQDPENPDNQWILLLGGAHQCFDAVAGRIVEEKQEGAYLLERAKPEEKEYLRKLVTDQLGAVLGDLSKMNTIEHTGEGRKLKQVPYGETLVFF